MPRERIVQTESEGEDENRQNYALRPTSFEQYIGQEQLIRKDLPSLTGRAGLTCRTALVKGRGNYLCRRKAAQAAAQPSQLIEDDLVEELRRVLEWAAQRPG